MTAFSDIRTRYVTYTPHCRSRRKISIHYNQRQVFQIRLKGINIIFSIIYDDSLDLTAAISLRSDKVLDELISKTVEKQTKPGDDSAQENNDTADTTPTYKPL